MGTYTGKIFKRAFARQGKFVPVYSIPASIYHSCFLYTLSGTTVLQAQLFEYLIIFKAHSINIQT
jgi:hypothetical protein